MNFFEQIFSIKNEDIKKVITVFGIKIKFKSRKLLERKKLAELENKVTKLNEKLNKQNEKLHKLKEKQNKQKEQIKNQQEKINNLKEKINNQTIQLSYNINDIRDYSNKVNTELTNLKEKVTPIIQSYVIPHINKEKVDYAIDRFSQYALNETEEREKKVIISLTSYPDRMYDIHYALFSLLNQDFKPDKIILWLTKEQFPNLEKDIPPKVLDFCKFGLTIKWYNENIKSHTKLIPSLKEYPEDIIVTADDDLYYERDWLKKLYEGYLESDRKTIIAHRCHQFGFDNEILSYTKWRKCIVNDESAFTNFITNCGGVLYPPHVLHNDIFNQDLFMTLAPTADDVWFWAMALLNNTKIKIVKEPNKLVYTNILRELRINGDSTLYTVNQIGNDRQIEAVINHYPEILEKIKQDLKTNEIFV